MAVVFIIGSLCWPYFTPPPLFGPPLLALTDLIGDVNGLLLILVPENGGSPVEINPACLCVCVCALLSLAYNSVLETRDTQRQL